MGEELWARMVEKNVARDVRSYNTRLLGLALEKKSGEMVKFLGEKVIVGSSATCSRSLPWLEVSPV